MLVVHGPNLNLLGVREPNVYGSTRLTEINEELTRLGRGMNLTVRCYQSNHEGAIVDNLQAAMGTTHGIIINPAAYTHTSIAIRDALLTLA
ncbi:MAG: 3-dehydroquinate dehydratase, partial [Desulfatitalea sp.]|nr:3-dehydroquinate dehydratase [Desulfatitalea sp.]